MRGIFRIEFQRAVRNNRWFIVWGLALASFFTGWIRYNGFNFGDPFTYTPNAFNYWMLITDFGFFEYVAPLIATMPFADSLITDLKQGFSGYVNLRCSYRQYFRAKVISNAIAGALAIALPLILLIIILVFIYPTQVGQSEYISRLYNRPDYPVGPLGFLYQGQPFLYITFLIILGGLFGAVYASVGLTLSSMVKNPHWVLATPFLFFCLASYMAERSARFAVFGHPTIAILPFIYPSLPIQIIGQYIALILFCLACNYFLGNKKHMLGKTYR